MMKSEITDPNNPNCNKLMPDSFKINLNRYASEDYKINDKDKFDKLIYPRKMKKFVEIAEKSIKFKCQVDDSKDKQKDLIKNARGHNVRNKSTKIQTKPSKQVTETNSKLRTDIEKALNFNIRQNSENLVKDIQKYQKIKFKENLVKDIQKVKKDDIVNKNDQKNEQFKNFRKRNLSAFNKVIETHKSVEPGEELYQEFMKRPITKENVVTDKVDIADQIYINIEKAKLVDKNNTKVSKTQRYLDKKLKREAFYVALTERFVLGPSNQPKGHLKFSHEKYFNPTVKNPNIRNLSAISKKLGNSQKHI